MTLTADYHPTDLEGAAERKEETRKRQIAAELQRRDDMAWLVSEPRGRRRVRQILRDGGFDVDHDHVPTVLNSDYGRMCFAEGSRVEALRTLWPLLRMVAKGHVPVESFRLLLTEKDEL